MATCGLLYGERAASLLSYSPIDRKIALCIAAGTLNAHSVLNVHWTLDITHCLGHKLQIQWIKRSGRMEFHTCSDILGVAKLLWIALKVVSVQVRLVHTGCTYISVLGVQEDWTEHCKKTSHSTWRLQCKSPSTWYSMVLDVWHGIAKHTVSVHEKLQCNSPTDYHGMVWTGRLGQKGETLGKPAQTCSLLWWAIDWQQNITKNQQFIFYFVLSVLTLH